MDLTTITAAYNGLKTAKDLLSAYTKIKTETKSLEKINEAVKNVAEAQDALFHLRDENFKLQEENNHLKQQLNEKEDWQKRLADYELVTTIGGAVVYKSKQGTSHYICPSCLEKKAIQILQDRRVMSGDYGCPACKAQYPINPMKHVGPVSIGPDRFGQ